MSAVEAGPGMRLLRHLLVVVVGWLTVLASFVALPVDPVWAEAPLHRSSGAFDASAVTADLQMDKGINAAAMLVQAYAVMGHEGLFAGGGSEFSGANALSQALSPVPSQNRRGGSDRGGSDGDGNRGGGSGVGAEVGEEVGAEALRSTDGIFDQGDFGSPSLPSPDLPLDSDIFAHLWRPAPRIFPPVGGPHAVGLTTWLAIDQTAWQPVEWEIAGSQYLAEPIRTVWDFSDGESVTCEGPGSAFTPGAEGSPECGRDWYEPSVDPVQMKVKIEYDVYLGRGECKRRDTGVAAVYAGTAGDCVEYERSDDSKPLTTQLGMELAVYDLHVGEIQSLATANSSGDAAGIAAETSSPRMAQDQIKSKKGFDPCEDLSKLECALKRVFVDGIGGVLESLSEVIGFAVDSLNDLVGWIFENLPGLFEFLEELLGEAVEAIGSVIKAVLDNIVAILQTGFVGWFESLIQAVNEFSATFKKDPGGTIAALLGVDELIEDPAKFFAKLVVELLIGAVAAKNPLTWVREIIDRIKKKKGAKGTGGDGALGTRPTALPGRGGSNSRTSIGDGVETAVDAGDTVASASDDSNGGSTNGSSTSGPTGDLEVEASDQGRPAVLCTATNSFVAGTRVLLAGGGSRAIELVVPGDLVVSYDTVGGVWSVEPVLAQWSAEFWGRLATVDFVGGGSVTATAGHEFWSEGDGWVELGGVSVGGELFGTGGVVGVEGLEVKPFGRSTVWELDVANTDTFVTVAGGQNTVVHNGNVCGRQSETQNGDGGGSSTTVRGDGGDADADADGGDGDGDEGDSFDGASVLGASDSDGDSGAVVRPDADADGGDGDGGNEGDSFGRDGPRHVYVRPSPEDVERPRPTLEDEINAAVAPPPANYVPDLVGVVTLDRKGRAQPPRDLYFVNDSSGRPIVTGITVPGRERVSLGRQRVWAYDPVGNNYYFADATKPAESRVWRLARPRFVPSRVRTGDLYNRDNNLIGGVTLDESDFLRVETGEDTEVRPPFSGEDPPDDSGDNPVDSGDNPVDSGDGSGIEPKSGPPDDESAPDVGLFDDPDASTGESDGQADSADGSTTSSDGPTTPESDSSDAEASDAEAPYSFAEDLADGWSLFEPGAAVEGSAFMARYEIMRDRNGQRVFRLSTRHGLWSQASGYVGSVGNFTGLEFRLDFKIPNNFPSGAVNLLRDVVSYIGGYVNWLVANLGTYVTPNAQGTEPSPPRTFGDIRRAERERGNNFGVKRAEGQLKSSVRLQVGPVVEVNPDGSLAISGLSVIPSLVIAAVRKDAGTRGATLRLGAFDMDIVSPLSGISSSITDGYPGFNFQYYNPDWAHFDGISKPIFAGTPPAESGPRHTYVPPGPERAGGELESSGSLRPRGVEEEELDEDEEEGQQRRSSRAPRRERPEISELRRTS